jgi:hypothetical protein
MHLAGWNFTILEDHQSANSMNVIDVKIPDFFEAQELALQQYKPNSKITYFRPLADEELSGAIKVGSFRKWIPLGESDCKAETQPLTDLWPNVERVNFVSK